MNRFLADLFARRDVVKLGFGLEHDFSRLRRSFPGSLACVAEPARACAAPPGSWTCARACALVFPEKRKLRKAGLAVTVASVLGAYVDKTEQCSDWARRPLAPSQVAYAAADAHVLTALFDRCAHRSAAEVAAALSDPEAPLARPPDATAREGEPRDVGGGGARDRRDGDTLKNKKKKNVPARRGLLPARPCPSRTSARRRRGVRRAQGRGGRAHRLPRGPE